MQRNKPALIVSYAYPLISVIAITLRNLDFLYAIHSDVNCGKFFTMNFGSDTAVHISNSRSKL